MWQLPLKLVPQTYPAQVHKQACVRIVVWLKQLCDCRAAVKVPSTFKEAVAVSPTTGFVGAAIHQTSQYFCAC